MTEENIKIIERIFRILEQEELITREERIRLNAMLRGQLERGSEGYGKAARGDL